MGQGSKVIPEHWRRFLIALYKVSWRIDAASCSSVVYKASVAAPSCWLEGRDFVSRLAWAYPRQNPNIVTLKRAILFRGVMHTHLKAKANLDITSNR